MHSRKRPMRAGLQGIAGDEMKSRWVKLQLAILGVLLVAVTVQAQVTTTTVQGVVYRADGTPAHGYLLITWHGFVTAGNQSVAAGDITVPLAADGTATVNLTANQGATPAGTYYTVVYHLNDGTVSREYWTVPAAATATIASVQAQLEPAMVAVQNVSKSYVDTLVATLVPTASNYLSLAGGAMQGPLTLSGDPSASVQAATKHYVDSSVATAVPLTGGTVSGTLAVLNDVTKLPRVDVRDPDFAGGADPAGLRDSTAAIQAAIAFAQASSPSGEANYPSVYFASGHYLVNGTLRIPNNMHLAGDSRVGAILQETNASANLITVYQSQNCTTYSCYGGVDNLTLEGSGKATSGTLLELDSGFLTLRNLQFYNSGGRGLQMNAAAERVMSYDLSFYRIRWPLVMGGDTNEDYFYNTHVIEAGQTADGTSAPGVVNHYCYSVNCVGGVYEAQGTTASPAMILPDPHGSIDIDKAVNVSFIGGSVKSTYMVSGVKVWSGTVVRFQNFYHEAPYYGGQVLPINRAYMVGGKGEQTYLTAVLPVGAVAVAVSDTSWMPQYFGLASDGAADDGDYYPYVILPQDYNRASSSPSAYVSGLNQNQYEIVNAEGFAADGLLHIQPGGRHSGGNAPANVQWPAGSVVEEYTTGGASLELDGVHINQVQGPATAGGWQVGCSQTTANACGEVLVGYAPDVQAPTASPATNQVGFYAPLNDANDPVVSAVATLRMRHMEMFSSASNPYQGMVVAEHRAVVSIDGPLDPERVESQRATVAGSSGMQVDISAATGGSKLFTPLYSTGTVAGVNLSMAEGEVVWDSLRQIYHKHTAIFGPYQQYGQYMAGTQYQNVYCLFDTPTTDGAHVNNRFCATGGPNNTGGSGPGYGGGIGYDSWNGSGWTSAFRVQGNGGTGSLTASVPSTFGSSVSISGTTTVTGALTANGGATVSGALTTSGAASIAGLLKASGGASVAGALAASGNASVAGMLTASQVNGTITVDGVTYGTLNQAWSAAVTAATASGRNQTIWLGPGTFAVTATMNEPVNGACVSVIGSAGTTVGADIASTATMLTVPNALNGDVFYLGNAVLTEGCTFKDLNILAAAHATHGLEFQWARGLLLDTVSVNDTTAEGVLLGEEAANGHQMNSLLRNVTVSYSAAAFSPATRPLYGIHLQKTAIDSAMHTILVRNAQTAAVWNEGTGNLGYGVHGFGYPYTCSTAPCSNTATSGSAANASYASSYVIYDTGGAGSVWTDTYADSPAVSAFYLGANGTTVYGGHVQWPDLVSFPNANLASVTAAVTNGLEIADVGCLGMSSSVNWINYASASGVPPTFASVHHLTGCGNYYQALEPATTTGFSGGGASNNAPGNGAVAAVWAAPKAGSATYSAYSAQEYTGYQGDLFDGHIAGAMPFFNITYQGTIRSQGGIALSTVLNTAATLTLTTANKNVIANAASGAQTLMLPSCYTAMPDKATPTGLELTVVKSDTSANAVTVQTASAQLINYAGATAQTLVIGSAGKRTLVCGPDYNWYAF